MSHGDKNNNNAKDGLCYMTAWQEDDYEFDIYNESLGKKLDMKLKNEQLLVNEKEKYILFERLKK